MTTIIYKKDKKHKCKSIYRTPTQIFFKKILLKLIRNLKEIYKKSISIVRNIKKNKDNKKCLPE